MQKSLDEYIETLNREQAAHKENQTSWDMQENELNERIVEVENLAENLELVNLKNEVHWIWEYLVIFNTLAQIFHCQIFDIWNRLYTHGNRAQTPVNRTWSIAHECSLDWRQ